MKHIFSLLAFLLTVAGALGQSHQSASFLNVRSCMVSNVMQITNLLATGTYFTNKPGTIWTNLAGTKVSATVANGGARFNVFRDVNLWPSQNDTLPPMLYLPTEVKNAYSTNSTIIGGSTVMVRVVGNSGANSAVTFVFTPIWDGETDTYLTTADQWTFAVTANTTTPVILATNVPTWRWPGAKALRLARISNGDTDADSEVFVTHCSLNGFRP